MYNLFSSIIATLITMPILVYIFVFVMAKQLTKNHRKAVQLGLDISTLFFILSVHFLVLVIWEESFLSIIFIFLLFCAIIFVLINWKVKGEIVFSRFFKGFWRFSFLVFFIAYLGLTIYGLYQSVRVSL
jgi:hypothetical protein